MGSKIVVIELHPRNRGRISSSSSRVNLHLSTLRRGEEDDDKRHVPPLERDKRIAQYGERLLSLALFGSCARREERKTSDIDLLVVADG